MNFSILNSNSDDYPKAVPDVVSLVDDLLRKAIDSGASDIHFEPTESELAVKYRIDGVLGTVEKLPKHLSNNVITRLKVLGGLLSYRNDIPQEGRIEIDKTQNGIKDQRLAIFPTINGQRAVVRLFYQNKSLMELNQLGFSNEICKLLKRVAAKNQGVLLLTGPAGSGKSTTLAALLRYIMGNYSGNSIDKLTHGS